MENLLRCSVCGCLETETPKFYKQKQLCNKHYIQMYRYGRVKDPPVKNQVSNIHLCDICGDTKSTKYIQWNQEGDYKNKVVCNKHYQQLRMYGECIDNIPSGRNKERVCSVCGSVSDVIYCPSEDKMFCRRHYSQLKHYGKLFERTVFDRNEYRIEGDHAVIVLRNRKQEIMGETIIDIDDLERIIPYKWRLNTWNYAETRINGKSIMLQKIILNTKEKIDHIDRNTLNNRKSNLRIITQSENAVNCDIRSNNTSGITGVSWSNALQAWRAYINVNGQRIELGTRRNKEKAIRLRLEAEMKYYGEYAPQKDLFKQYGIGAT